MIGCRYHSIVFAMQIGKPFIAINYDAKVGRLLQESDLTDCCLETTEFDRLPQKIQWLEAHETELKQKINAFAAAQIEQAADLRAAVQAHLKADAAPVSLSFVSSLKSIAKRYVRT